MLEQTQQQGMDVTAWLQWFLTALVEAGMLVKAPGGGRSSAYALPDEFAEPGRE